jgi:hypothetical protein
MQLVAFLVGCPQFIDRMSSCKILAEAWPDAFTQIEFRSGVELA